jgi:hypothetical protein
MSGQAKNCLTMSISDIRSKVKVILQKERNPQEVSCKPGRGKVPTPTPESPCTELGMLPSETS